MTKLKEKIANLNEKQFEELIHDLAHKQFFEITLQESKLYMDDFKKNVELFDFFDAINTDNIKQLDYPIENTHFHLRNDEEVIQINGKDWLETRKHDADDYMEVTYEK